MKTKNLLTGLLAAAALFASVEVSAMQLSDDVTQAVESSVSQRHGKRGKRQREVRPNGGEEASEQVNGNEASDQVNNEAALVQVKTEPGCEGHQVARIVLPGGEDRSSAIDVDKINADIVAMNERSDALKRQISAAKGVSTKRAGEIKELKEELAAVTTELNKKIAALAKALKKSTEDNKALNGKVVAFEATVAALQAVCDAMQGRLDAIEGEDDKEKADTAVNQDVPRARSWFSWGSQSPAQPAAK